MALANLHSRHLGLPTRLPQGKTRLGSIGYVPNIYLKARSTPRCLWGTILVILLEHRQRRGSLRGFEEGQSGVLLLAIKGVI